jgi:hypothetical protein
MGNYRIKVNIEIVECGKDEKEGACLEQNGSFTMTIGEKEAESIDECERSLLATAHPAIRKALSKHLEEMSKKKTSEKAEDGQRIAPNHRPYRIDGEAGRFEFATHCVFDGDDKPVFDSATDFYPALGSREYYRTVGFKEIAYIYGDTEKSFRKTADLPNRVRYQQVGGTPFRTLRESTEREGGQIIDLPREKTARCLRDNGFDEEGRPVAVDAKHSRTQPAVLEDEELARAAQTLQAQHDIEKLLSNPVLFESRESTVNVAIDDATVKRQKAERTGGRTDPAERKGKKASNTICHVEKGRARYTLNGGTIKEVLLFLIAFLFENGLTGNRVQFFTDGHTILNDSILRVFCWFGNIGIVLDWFHLDKKCKEKLSMALKGRQIRNEVLDGLLPLLWHGLTQDAIACLKGVDAEKVKNKEAMAELVAYLERNIAYIPCYALRKQLGLRNGSSIGEKMNDLIVADRQKHNGMAWSKSGSVALATVTSLKRNGESGKWFGEGDLDFRLAA